MLSNFVKFLYYVLACMPFVWMGCLPEVWLQFDNLMVVAEGIIVVLVLLIMLVGPEFMLYFGFKKLLSMIPAQTAIVDKLEMFHGRDLWYHSIFYICLTVILWMRCGQDHFWITSGAIYLIWCGVLMSTGRLIISPVLILMGFKFYTFRLKDNPREMLLISDRLVSDPNSIKTMKPVFENRDFMLDK